MNRFLCVCKASLLFLAAAIGSCSDDGGVNNVGKVEILQSDLTADGMGEEKVIHVKSNAYWHLEFTDEQSGETIRWITADLTEGSGDQAVTLTVSRNRSAAVRSARISVVTDSGNTSYYIALSQGGGIPESEGYDFPIVEMFQIDENAKFSNGFIDGNNCYFNGGMVLTRTGSTDASLTFACPSHTAASNLPAANSQLQRGVTAAMWSTGDAWEITIPLKNQLSGNMRLMYGSRRDNSTGTNPWTYEWSADGDSWNTFEGVLSAGSDAVWKYIDFTIPEAKAIPAGGKLILRMTPTSADKLGSTSSATVLFHHGICIMPARAAKSTVAEMDTERVVLSDGFDDLIDNKAAYMEFQKSGFMTATHDGAYSVPVAMSDYLAVENAYVRPGYLQLGGADDAKNTYTTTGKVTLSTTRLTDMNIQQTDLKLTFYAASYLAPTGVAAGDNVKVTVDAVSGAEVDAGGVISGLAANEFKAYTVYIRKAAPTTKITILNATDKTDCRFFVDDIQLQVEGTPTRPDVNDPVSVGIADVRALKGSSAVTISANNCFSGRVVSVDNVPAGCFAVCDDKAGIFVKMPSHGLAVGDAVKVIVKGAVLATDANGLLVVTPTAASMIVKESTTAVVPEAKSITISDLKSGTYEGMYVVLPEMQVQTADLAKTLSGEIALEDERGETCKMTTFSAASFAAQAVPQKSGVVKGVAGASTLMPVSTADLAAMTGSRFGEAVYAITPISCILQLLGSGTNLTFRNVSYADKTVTFSSPAGCSITKVGGGTAADCSLIVKSGSKNFYDGRFVVKGWGGSDWQANGLVFKMKATSRLVGDLRFGFGIFAASASLVPQNWKIMWSTDNANWNGGVKILTVPFDTPEDTFSLGSNINSGGYKMAVFNLPESKAVAVGGSIYVKIMQADNVCQVSGQEIDPQAGEVIFQHGFYLSTHAKRAYHTTQFASDANVLLAEGFDDAFLGHDNFIPSWQFMTNYNSPYTLPEGWSAEGDIFQMPGYIRVGKAAASVTGITTPALTALGSAAADVTLKFKAAVLLVAAVGYVPDAATFGVSVNSGTVVSQPDLSALPAAITTVTEQTATEMETAYHRWQEVTVRITGATKDTRITISNTGRHFIDDVVVTKE